MNDTTASNEITVATEIAKTNRLLITGANGFIGRTLIDCLSGETHKIVALVRSTQSKEELVSHLATSNQPQHQNDPNFLVDEATFGITVLVADITKPEELTRVLVGLGDEVTSVIHLAGLAHVGRDNDSSYHRVNTEGSLNLIEALGNNVSRFIYLSSSLASAAENKGRDSTSYGESKLAAENQLRTISEARGIQLGILRPCNVYGTRMRGNLKTLIKLIRHRILPPLPSYHNKLSLVSDTDVVKAIQLQLGIEVLSSKPYYITDGRSYSTKDIETAIYRALKLKIPKWKTPNVIIYSSIWMLSLLGHLPGVNHSISRRTYENLVNDNFYSNKDAQLDLGFNPSTDFYKELQKIVEAV